MIYNVDKVNFFLKKANFKIVDLLLSNSCNAKKIKKK